jgi:hypothetical protein
VTFAAAAMIRSVAAWMVAAGRARGSLPAQLVAVMRTLRLLHVQIARFCAQQVRRRMGSSSREYVPVVQRRQAAPGGQADVAGDIDS